MPIYDYKCPQCGWKIAQKRSIDDATPAPTCGDCLVVMDKVYSPIPAHFKGEGWGKSK